ERRKPAMTLTLVSHLLCPYVQRAAIALREKNVVFERVVIDLANKPAWFLKISPLGKVPLLRVPRPDGGESILFESNVICEYIEVFDELHDSHVFDRTPKVRAWRQALRERPSVRDAVVPQYRQHLRTFLEKHEAHLLTLAGRR